MALFEAGVKMYKRMGRKHETKRMETTAVANFDRMHTNTLRLFSVPESVRSTNKIVTMFVNKNFCLAGVGGLRGNNGDNS